MKINFVLPFTNPTGGIRVVYEYANHLTEKGHDVVCYVPLFSYKFNNSGLKGLYKRIKSSIGNLYKYNRDQHKQYVKCTIKFIPIISNLYVRKADITIATAWPTAHSINKMRDKAGEKVYFIQHYETWSGPEEDVDASYKLNLHKITIAKWLKELMEEKFNSFNVQIVHNGNDLIIPTDRLKKYNSPLKFLLMYNSLEWKGFKEGIKAFELVREKYPEIKLTIFGSEVSDDVPKYAEFVYNPTRTQLKELYFNSDIYIFPSKFEGWGLTVIEAMACKCAVVGTQVGAMEDFGIHKKTAMISEPNDFKKMADNIEELLCSHELLDEITDNAYNLAIQLDWRAAGDKFEKVIQSYASNQGFEK